MQNEFTSNGVSEAKQGRSTARQKAKQPASYRRMYHERAMGLLSPKQRKLIKDFFDQDGKQIIGIKSLESGPEKQALAQYGKTYTEVMKHVKDRKTESEKFVISIPTFIFLQPDLSFLEKHLLADIYELQQKPRGCFKGNRAFAVELGTTVGNIKDMLRRLKSFGFLHEQPDEQGERLLTVSKHFLELVGQCALTDPSVPTDRKQEQNNDATRMDIEDSAEGDSPRPQGDNSINQQQPPVEAAARRVVVVAKTRPGAAAPGDPRRALASEANAPTAQAAQPTRKQSVKPSSPAKGAPRQSACQMSTGETDGAADASGEAGAAEGQSDSVETNAHRFLEFFQKAHKSKYGTTAKVTEADRVAVRNLIRQDEWMVSDLVLILLRAWDLIGRKAKNGYPFPCCQHSRRLVKFVEHLDKICADTKCGNIRELPVEKVVGEIAQLTELDSVQVEQFFAPELEQENAAKAEPEMKLEDVPDLKAINVKSYVMGGDEAVDAQRSVGVVGKIDSVDQERQMASARGAE